VKDMQELVRLLEKSGFTFVRYGRHDIWRCPCGHTTVAASTGPGGPSRLTAARALIRRTLRACIPSQEKRAA
jgi:hypothetical protein